MFDGWIVSLLGEDSKIEGLETLVSIVGIPQLDIEACKGVAKELGVPLRVRPYRRSTSALEKRLGSPSPRIPWIYFENRVYNLN